MLVAPKRLKTYSRKACAGFLAIWLSGIALLLICNVQSASAMADCPLAKLGVHCDKEAAASKDPKVFTGQDDKRGIDCCAFISAFFDRTRTFDGKQQIAPVALAATVAAARPLFLRSAAVPVIAYRSTVLLKNTTYLKNRTFRI